MVGNSAVVFVASQTVSQDNITVADMSQDFSTTPYAKRTFTCDSVKVKFSPAGTLTSTLAIPIGAFAQIFWVDPATSRSVQITKVVPLSNVNPTTLSARIPEWLSAVHLVTTGDALFSVLVTLAIPTPVAYAYDYTVELLTQLAPNSTVPF
jgi:hypothetical protein